MEQRSAKGGNFVTTAVYFSTQSLLDLHEHRLNMLRVPEILRMVHRTQDVIDRRLDCSVDLANIMSADDEVFLASNGLRSLSTAIVQIGLFHRYVKNNSLPEFLIGNCRGDSAIEVIVGRMSLEQMVLKSAAFQEEQRTQLAASNGLPILAGSAMPELAVYKREEVDGFPGEHVFNRTSGTTGSLREVFVGLQSQQKLDHWVVLGTGTVAARREHMSINSQSLPVQMEFSLDSDPRLEWFGRPTMPKLFAVSAH